MLAVGHGGCTVLEMPDGRTVLYDAGAMNGPDVTRRIYPVVATITSDGFRRLTDEEAGRYAEAVVAERMRSPGGPIAPLHPTSQQNE